MTKRSSTLIFLFKIMVSIGALFWVFRKFSNEMPPLSDIDPRSIIFSSALLFAQPVLIGFRWKKILEIYGARPRVTRLVEITWISVFCNQFLPAGVGGDAVRVLMARQEQISLPVALTSVAIDRVVALLALAFSVLVFTPILAPLVDVSILVICALIGGIGVAVAWGLSLWLLKYPNAVPTSRILAKLMLGLRFVLYVLSDFWRSLTAFLLSVMVHFLSAIAFAFIALGVGIDLQFLDLMSVAMILTFAQVVPISIGGWGVREAAAVGLLAHFGVDGGMAIIASVLLGVAYLIASLPGAAIWPFRARMRAREL
ncbi:MAG: lysylphosphatidylglycerol synthase transmembrane domain-containing protein [Pseudomonadota bacterium]